MTRTLADVPRERFCLIEFRLLSGKHYRGIVDYRLVNVISIS